MQDPWRAKAAEFNLRAGNAGEPDLRDKYERAAVAYAKAADFRARAEGADDPHFRDEFARIATAYATLAAECANMAVSGDDPRTSRA